MKITMIKCDTCGKEIQEGVSHELTYTGGVTIDGIPLPGLKEEHDFCSKDCMGTFFGEYIKRGSLPNA